MSSEKNIYKRQPLGMSLGGQKIKAVIIDDSTTARHQIRQILLSVHFDIIDEFGNGNDAAEKIKKQNIRPEYIFLDIEMPVMDGISFIKEIKPFVPEIKIIMVSVHTERDNIQKLTKLGINGFIKKPFTRESFLEQLSKIFGYKD